MKEPTSLLVCGDWHGDPQHAMWCFQKALDENADAVFQVGDFGFWVHMPQGESFLDLCSNLATENDMPLYWIDGNHESHTLLRELYGPGGKYHSLTPEGFWVIRPGVFYVPRGTRWVWNDKHLMGLGGAYSVDKSYRLAREQGIAAPEWGWTWKDAYAHPAMGPGTMWWPEEEISEDDLKVALSDPTPLDVLFTHDKPRASNPGWNRKDLPECYGNQDKIQEVVRTLTPRVLIHGHLHYPYREMIRAYDDKSTLVCSLHCNPTLSDPDITPEQVAAQRAASVDMLRL